MGELKVDLHQLRTVAAAMREAAEAITEIDWPHLESGAMRGSAVTAGIAPSVVATHVTDLVARLRAGATDAQAAAATLERTDSLSAHRLDR